MGRLQKKKAPVDKKKKGSTSKSPDLSPGKPPSGKNTALAASSAKGLRKRAVPSKKKATKALTGAGSNRKNYPDLAIQFLREVMMELKKVTWPSRKQTTGSTIVMIILVTIFSVFLGTVDIGLSKLIQVILQ